jgi:hypothetical protein
MTQFDSPEVIINSIDGGVRISWAAVNGATRYLVYGSNDSDTGFSQIAQVTGTQYDDTSAVPYRFFYVTAADGALARDNRSK